MSPFAIVVIFLCFAVPAFFFSEVLKQRMIERDRRKK